MLNLHKKNKCQCILQKQKILKTWNWLIKTIILLNRNRRGAGRLVSKYKDRQLFCIIKVQGSNPHL